MISGFANVEVITADFNEPALRGRETPGFRFHFVKQRPWQYRPKGVWWKIEHSALKPLMNLSYSFWLRQATRLARELTARERYDVVHLVTYVGFRFPGGFAGLGVPFVWGPIGGLENTPWRFLAEMGWHGGLFFACRNLINTLQKWLLPGPRRAMRTAGLAGGLIAATEGIRREIKRCYGQESTVICEVGPPGEVATGITDRSAGEPLRIAWSGLHVPGKALPLLLRALAGLGERVDWRLTLLGVGPLTGKWQAMARELGIGGRIEWTGKLPRDEAVRRVREAHVFALTSLKDLTSTVLLEALSQAVPVVCLDHCGFSDVVTEGCGLKVRMESRRQVVKDLGEAIAKLGEDEGLRRRLATGALERIGEFSWEKKAEVVERIYRQVVERSGGCRATARR
jgi:glycosyltransferase involved in cell wall biosynthesis